MEVALPSWFLVLWYFGFFGAAHVVMVPVLATWFAFLDAVEKWIRSVVERELIRVDLQSYQTTLERVFPRATASSDQDHPA